MINSFINELFPEKLITAFCWTLVHSLWQGLFLVLIAGIIILSTRRSNPAVRYNLLSALFCLFLVIVLFTFFTELNQDELTINRYVFSRHHSSVNNANLPKISIEFINKHGHLVALLWLVAALIKGLKMCAELWYLQRLRTVETSEVPTYWHNRFVELCDLLQIEQTVQLLQSYQIDTPGVIGFVKPVILVPFGFFNHLPPDQVEAVLLHELAHIKRYDYLIHLLQRFAEILFFFNPPVTWLLLLIKAERENCCDDIALKHTGSKKKFIEALVCFQDCNFSLPAISFSGSHSSLFSRIVRIATNKNTTLSVTELTFLLLSPFLLFIISIFFGKPTSLLSINKISTPSTEIINKTTIAQNQNDAFYLNKSNREKPKAGKLIGKLNGGEEYNVGLKAEYINKSRTALNKPAILQAQQKADEQKGEETEGFNHNLALVESNLSPKQFENNTRLSEEFPASLEEHRREAAAMKKFADKAKEQSDRMKEEHNAFKKMGGPMVII